MDCEKPSRKKARSSRATSRCAAIAIIGIALFGVSFTEGANADETSRSPVQPLLLFDTEENPEATSVTEPTKKITRSTTSKRFSEKVLDGEIDDSKTDDSGDLKRSPEGEPEDVVESDAPASSNNDQSADESSIDDNSTVETRRDDDPALFPNLRPFRRARERFFGTQSAAPTPPTPPAVEPIGPENAAVISAAKPPMLSRESETLPPFGAEAEETATLADLDALRAETKALMWKKGDLKITPYGFLNLAVSSDTQRAVPGEYILFLQDPAVDSSADFAVDARTSRLGLKIEGPRIEPLCATLGGAAEFDFQGVASGSKNKGGVQLRRAFAELVDAQHERRLVAGQDWEIISPGAPQMLNYLPGAFAGNIQYRRAQLRYEQGLTLSPDLHFLGQIGIFDDVLGDYTSTAGVTPMSAGWPVIEGRIAVELFKQARCGLPITVGVSGHIGEQYYKFSPIVGSAMASTVERKEIKTWSANVDVDIPITQQFKLQGEYYQGTNLSSFCGGINQGIDLYRRDSIDDRGGWLAAHYAWTKKLSTNIGYGIDKPKGSDLAGTTVAAGGVASARTKNEIYFTNAIYNWTANFMTGLEVSYWQTGYQKADVSGGTASVLSKDKAEAVRTEFVTRLTF